MSDPALARNSSPTALVNHAFRISDGEFAGKVDLRYIPATGAVPDSMPGHVGFSVVPRKLIRLLPDWKTPGGMVHAVFPSRRGMIPAVRALLDFLVAGFALPEIRAG